MNALTCDYCDDVIEGNAYYYVEYAYCDNACFNDHLADVAKQYA